MSDERKLPTVEQGLDAVEEADRLGRGAAEREFLRAALEQAAQDLTSIAAWSLHWRAKPVKAREAEMALGRVRAALAAARAVSGEDTDDE